jgi:hypothetical protein
MSTDITRDNLCSPNQYPVVSKDVEIAASQTLARGCLIGKQILDDEITVTPTGFTPATTATAALDTTVLAKVGTYTATCVAVVSTTGGVFQVTDPDGLNIGVAYTTVEFNGGGLVFTLPVSNGSDDYAVGDTYEFVVAAGDGLGYALDTANGDGTNKIFGVLLRSSTTDVGETDVCPVAKTGRFMSQALTAADGVTITDLIDALEEKNIYIDLSDADNDLIGG